MFTKYRKAKNDFKAFKQLSIEKKKFVFYSEGRAYWCHLGPIVMELIGELKQEVVYVTSDLNDHVFDIQSNYLKCFYIGEGFIRTLFFKTLDAQLCIMTSPDLDVFYIKRSIHPVHYVYVFHSIVSTHMVYRKKAFFYYDTVLYPGKYHKHELELTEKLYNLPKKHLLSHGYGRLDAILAKEIKQPTSSTVLIAPSWGKNSLLNIAEQIIGLLIDNYNVILRPHPQSFKETPKLLRSIVKLYHKNPKFIYDDDFNGTDSLDQSLVLITDWSGVAYDYAFGYLKPVLFVDVPKKINNPEYEQLGVVPFEDAIRSQVGAVVKVNELHKMGSIIDKFIQERPFWSEQLKKIRMEHVCHLGDSGVVGAQHLISTLQRLSDVTASTNNKKLLA